MCSPYAVITRTGNPGYNLYRFTISTNFSRPRSREWRSPSVLGPGYPRVAKGQRAIGDIDDRTEIWNRGYGVFSQTKSSRKQSLGGKHPTSNQILRVYEKDKQMLKEVKRFFKRKKKTYRMILIAINVWARVVEGVWASPMLPWLWHILVPTSASYTRALLVVKPTKWYPMWTLLH